MIHLSHLKTAVKVLESYKAGQPFSLFLREFFRADKKYGSRDRKQVTRLCYYYFRIGQLATHLPVDERILLAVFLGGTAAEEFQPELKPAWTGRFGDSFEEKCNLAGVVYSVADHFPVADAISESIDPTAFAHSHFVQPDLFIRIRPGNVERVHQQLAAAGIGYRELSPSTLAFPNGTKLDEVLAIDKDVVIQDLSSQRVATLLPPAGENQWKTWDCCAASGGKSIMANDFLGKMDLTVSDIRQNILVNLQQRFERAGIKNYRSLVTDLGGAPATGKGLRDFNLVIADVPCSGSGTWGRTPEHLLYFTHDKMEYYSSLQKKIIDNSLQSLAPGGYYLYITCSVFRMENEDAVAHLLSKGMTLCRSDYFRGYSEKADTLFAALVKKD